MKLQGLKIKDKTIAEQVGAIKSQYGNFYIHSGPSHLRVRGTLQPTARSDQYLVEIKYQLKKFPCIYVLQPTLVKNFKGDAIPHIYPGEKLCLHQPKYYEFRFSDLIANTIIPWTSLWLYYYEVWHVTGEWLGGGEHPTRK